MTTTEPRGESDIGFDPTSEVDVRAVGDNDWRVLRDLIYRARTEKFTVGEGEITDFASIPRFFVWFIPRYGRYTRAAILHDHLLKNEVKQGSMIRRDADGVFLQAMRQLGVPFLRRWFLWTGVRWGSVTTRAGRKDWSKDAWRVAVLTLTAAPFLVPPALVIVATLLAFHVFEKIVWLTLETSQRLRGRPAEDVKKVNRPELSMKL